VQLAQATPAQMSVLEESHPKAKESDYYLFLVHQPEILRQRSLAFNAIMYAPGGLSRAERELASTVVSKINGCVYCASVHAQRSIELTLNPDHVNASSIQKLKDAGLQNSEILDLIHSIAIFAWANRLMLNLGEPIFPSV
jgi:alkylhydroperoxidase family enzyme